MKSKQPPEWLHHWPKFRTKMESRLAQGHLDYGDSSFDRPPKDLVKEIQEEVLDIVGWGFIMWCRLQALEAKVERVEVKE